MKILCFIDCLGPGGAQRQLVELGVGFKEKGHEVSFITYFDNPFFNPVLEEAGISLNCIEEPNYLKRLLKIRRFIRNGNFDAVLSFLEGVNFFCECAGLPFRKWKLVVGERNADPNISRSLKLIMYRWFHIFADYVVANSNSNLQIVRSVNPLLSESKCKVIYNVVDFARWRPPLEYEFRKTGRLKIIIAASHIYRKNLNGLLEGLALLKKEELGKIDIEWYGDHLNEPYYDNSFPEAIIKMKEMKLGNVLSFYPVTNQMIQKIQDADTVGLFSFIEGLPNIVCEGMACAKPVICSKV